MQAITVEGLWDESLLKQKTLKKFLGKKVIVTVIELEDEPISAKREWKYLGSVDLGGHLDEVNIRDFAHD